MCHRLVRLALLLAAGGACGCYSTTTIPLASLEAVSQGSAGRAVLVNDTAGHEVRIDPNTTLRLHLQDGTASEVVDARSLAASQDGLLFRETIRIADATAFIVGGLDETQRDLVERAIPSDAELTKLTDGSLRIGGDSQILRAWVTNALVALARQAAPADVTARAGALGREPCPVVYGMLGGPHATRGLASVPTALGTSLPSGESPIRRKI